MSDNLLPYTSSEEAEASPDAAQPNSTSTTELRSLDADASLKEALVRRETQVTDLRHKAYEHAVSVCFGFSAYLSVMVGLFSFGLLKNLTGEAQLAIFASPILSVAAITIFILGGVFGTPTSKSVSEEAQQLAHVAKESGIVS